MKTPCLNKGEKIILQAQGTLEYRGSRQLGYLFLTNKRLLFMQVTKKIFETDLDGIIDLSIVKRIFLLGVRVKQLCITLNYRRGQGRVYIAVKNPGKWSEMIKERMTLMLAERWGYNGAKPEAPSNTE
ncbi:hypothetical protein [Marinisporobacter balticus]|uniref:PH (Pleckstrin Homology) domain-containing protein n=1 Tax=Marinisporobacter balticus TaxID=2018667 RepID=A0A4R2L447_9FIRM|nr:hypothetical protein [Marinisporobacter balticus]TCO77368.1 hypothetical protein EV214_10610 [Marinisporobacter balticus]